MNEFKFYSSLRADLLNIITGVKNSNGWFSWDNTTPNHVTKKRLDHIYREYLKKATEFGFFVVTRHVDCSNSDHEIYCTSNIYKKNIPYQDANYDWHGGQVFQGERTCICPCSPDNGISEHQGESTYGHLLFTTYR